MDAILCIETRRSIRDYSDQPIKDDLVRKLIDFGMKAPSAGGINDTCFSYTLDKEQIKELGVCCFQKFVASAGGVIVISSIPSESYRKYGNRGMFLYSIQDAAACAQNILLAANALGLGACWVGAFDEARVKDLLALKPTVYPQIIIALGWPK